MSDERVDKRLAPKPHLRRIGRSTIALGIVAVFGVLTFLTFRYSGEAVEREAARRSVMAAQPLRPDQIEQIRQPRPVETPPPAPIVDSGPVSVATETTSPPRARRRAASRGFVRTPGTSSAAAVTLPGDPFRPRELPAPAPVEAPSTPRVISPAPTSPAPVEFRPPATDYLIRAGTYVPAVLAQALSSELAGSVRAQVSQDVYSSNGAALLIPRGTVLWGHQSRQPLLGERRLVVEWHQLLYPDGRTIDLPAAGSPPPAAGPDGSLGVAGRTRNHWGQRFGAAALLSVIGAGVQLSQPQSFRDSDSFRGADPQQVAAGELGLNLGRLSEQVLRQYVDQPPVIELSAGARLSLLVTRDLAFNQPY